MQGQGAELVEVEYNFDANQLASQVSVHLYDLKDHLNSYLEGLGPAAACRSLAQIIASGKYHAGIEANIKQAQDLSTASPEYQERLIKRLRLQEQVMKIMADQQLDALVYPHQKRLVVPIGQTQVERNGVLASITGFPAITLPGGFSRPTATAALGVPIGIEFLGRPWSEPILIKIAAGFEQATNYRRPPLSAPSL